MKVAISYVQGKDFSDLAKGFSDGTILLSFHEDCPDDTLHENVSNEFTRRNPNFSGGINHLVFPISDEIVCIAFQEILQRNIENLPPALIDLQIEAETFVNILLHQPGMSDPNGITYSIS